MKKSIVKLGLVTALSASLFGFTYEIKQGWQQLGALEDLNSSDLKAFNDKCVNYLWYYDNNDSSNPQWKLHIANGNDYDYCGETLTSLKKGQGFWANAKADCNISIGTTPDKPCVSDMPAPPDLEKPECMTCNTDTNTSSGDNNTSSNTITLEPANNEQYELPSLFIEKARAVVYYFGSNKFPDDVTKGDILTLTVKDTKIQLVRSDVDAPGYIYSDVIYVNNKLYKISDYDSHLEFAKAVRAILPDYIKGTYSSYLQTDEEVITQLTHK